MWTADNRGEGTVISVTTFRVLFGKREFADFILTDGWDICENNPNTKLVKDCSRGTKFTDFVHDAVQRKKKAAANAA